MKQNTEFDDQFLPASTKGTRPDVGGRLAGACRLCTMVCCRFPSISGMAAAPIRVQAWGGAVGRVRNASPICEEPPLPNCRYRRRQGRKHAFSRLRAFPRLTAEARRAEAVVAKRLAQRFVAGVRHTSCTEMHYSPRNKTKRDPSSTSVFLCSALPLPFLHSPPPPGARPARANGGRSGWHLPVNTGPRWILN